MIEYRKFSSIRKFGVELEVSNTVPKYRIKQIIKSVSSVPVELSGWRSSDNNDYWHIKNDASCGPKFGAGGYEIASYVGRGIEAIQHIAYVADYLRAKKVEVNDNCGLHVHVDCSDLNIKQMGTIIAYWLKIEHVIGMALPWRRHHSDFCCRMLDRCRWVIDRQKEYTAYHLWELMKPQNLTRFNNDDRHVTLNLVNYARSIWYLKWNERKTLELRWPEGTLNGNHIKNWLRLFLNFIESVKDREMPENTDDCCLKDVLSILGLHHEDQKFYILSEGLMETKTWFLARIVIYMSSSIYGRTQCHTLGREAKDLIDYMWNPCRYKDFIKGFFV